MGKTKRVRRPTINESLYPDTELNEAMYQTLLVVGRTFKRRVQYGETERGQLCMFLVLPDQCPKEWPK